ncbi:MAG: M1 family metallopeptidase [Clostridia bacterium]|nr:M1 family metallopeptidase [Clostridia bacterium]
MIKKVLLFLMVSMSSLFLVACKENSALGIKDLTTYTISANLDTENYIMKCTQKINVYNNEDQSLTELKLHLYPKAFKVGAKNQPVSALNTSQAYPNGTSYGDIVINSCFQNQEEKSFYLEGDDDNILVIPLSEELKVDKYTEISLDYTITLPNINHIFGYGNNAINLGNFYPILCVFENGEYSTNPYSSNGDPFYSDIANYKVDITYPSNYIIAYSGILLENKDDGLYRTSSFYAENVRDFAMSLSTKFLQKNSKVDGVEIYYYYYNDENPDTSLKACEDSLKTFNKLFGKYPYQQLSVCETNFVHGGMEYPNLVFISDDISSYNDYINTIVHEIAHQWWYGMVGNDEFSYGWLDEGLTEYSTALFYEENPDYQVTMKEIVTNTTNSYLLFVQVYTDVFGNCNTKMDRQLNQYDTEPEYVYIAYVKAFLLFNEIREIVGKEKFIKGLQNYFNEYKGKNVTPENFIQCMEKSTGRPISEIIYNYIDGKVIILANE